MHIRRVGGKLEMDATPPVPSPDSLGNPFVHSLLVTLGNHAVPGVQTYNWPCPVGPSANLSDDPPGSTQEPFPRTLSGFCSSFGLKTRLWSSHSYGIVRVQQTEGPQQCGEVCPTGQTAERHC